ncbi:beta-propeller fold lactonase family protein [Streptacidiphilus jiangxiensis]|uniref:6-phosphogluconolactonase, cycloisomerase 2 family n=1 Tax=Streptacidiphilus jiangxiensis TaxID=235985 RepID=A0A1H7TA09_STRJI|nr:beta-propeller fold lactonase family protein [Streptacidiphilus jiangxiensis]SEL81573.1 6-phosphogluconolactonase, cycloisomerase 2 family [Streptacidiphilus jiangxiensis]
MNAKNALACAVVTVCAVGVIAAAAPAQAAVTQAATQAASHGTRTTTVYTETNAVTGNAVLAYRADGTLVGSFATGGAGNGGGLGSQGAVTVADHGRTLYAVNVGSDTVSQFSTDRHGSLHLDGTAPTGAGPVSVAARGDRVYVLGRSTVSAYRRLGGHLVPLGRQSLSAGAAGAAEVAVVPDGRALLVTEKGSSTVDVLPLDSLGAPGPASSVPSAGQTPFGFAFGRGGAAVVSNVGAGAGASSASAYRYHADGTLSTTATAVPDGQTAACWVAVGPDGRTAYVENAGSGTVSTYAVGADGSLRLLDATAATPGGHVGDATVSGGALWILDNKDGRIDGVPLAADGTPGSPVITVAGLPASSAGLAAVTR